MKIHDKRGRVVLAAGLLLIAAAARGAVPTAFTYQGRLSDGDTPADGQFDFVFDLYTTPTGGTEPTTVSVDDVGVSDGYFTVLLDYGAGAFSGGVAWYLETRVRPHGGGAYETLSPRHPIVSVPYAQYAVTVKDSAITSAKIENGSISFVDIGQNGAGTDQVMKWNGAAWAPANDETGGGGGVTDHGDLTGLSGDDHLQYLRSDASDVFNDVGSSISLRFEGDTDANLLYLSGALDAVGIGTGSPDGKLQVIGKKVRIGDAGTVNWVYGDGDLYVEDCLEVDGRSYIDDDLTVGDGSAGYDEDSEYLKLSAQSADWFVGVQNEAASDDSDFNIGTSVGDEDTFHIERDGSVGIGTSAPGNAGLKVVNDASALAGATAWFQNNDSGGIACVSQTDSSQPNTFLTQYGAGNFLTCFDGTGYPVVLKKDGAVECGALTSRNAMSGVSGATLSVENDSATGIALVTDVDSSDVNTLLKQHGSGDFLYCDSFAGGWERVIRLKNDGTVECKVLNITGGSDLAEPFPSASGEGFAPGTVLVIDDETPGALALSEEPYDRRVAGVVSGAGGVNPGVMLRQTGSSADGECPIALSGRVYVRADASYGAIRPGELLTTSATPGHAMRVTEYDRAQGAVLGKAMSRLESGRGLVLVLVSLQ